MSDFPISIKPFGSNAILIEWPKQVSTEILEDILNFVDALKAKLGSSKEWETVSAYNSLTLISKGQPISFSSLEKQLKQWYLEKTNSYTSTKVLWRLPVCYDPVFGIDIAEVANQLKMSEETLIKQHTQKPYTIYGIGFLPGFMYLGGLPKSLEIARRSIPRLKVEKGAVGLAGKQTGIYPQQSPGGWNIIGNCPIPIFDIEKSPPCFVKVGDQVQFYQVSMGEYDLRKIEANVGIFKLQKTILDA